MNESQKLRNILIRTPFTFNVVAQLVSNWPSSSPTSSIYNPEYAAAGHWHQLRLSDLFPGQGIRCVRGRNRSVG